MNNQGERGVGEWLRWATGQLIASESARADAEILLAHCLQRSRMWLLTWADKPVAAEAALRFQQVVAERARGVPVAYLVGQRAFWTLNLKVTPDTLIPRPETELLVETALGLLAQQLPPIPSLSAQNPEAKHAASVLDLGTGTGAIALALASARPDLRILATDVSLAALAVAQVNAQIHRLTNVQFLQAHWFAGLPAQRFQMIVANPPYIAAQDPHLQQGDVRFEPLSALVADADGLADIRQIVQQAPDWLCNSGWLLLEHGYDQGQAVPELLQARGFQQVNCLHDWAGNPRVSLGQWLA